MESKKKSSIKLFSTAVILSIAVFSCTDNDPADTNSVMSADSSANMMDTAKMQADVNNTGIGKPNPAKKGMKGKVTIEPSKAMSPEAKMEADLAGVYSNVEIIPSFPGGYKGLQKFFDDNLQYPAEAANDGVEGTVTLTFVVDENGKLTSPQVAGEKLGYGLETEALRVIDKMPVWNPGKLKGKNVKTRFDLPVRFVLE